MYAEIDAASRRSTNADEFASAYHEAMRTATATRCAPAGRPRSSAGGIVTVPMRVSTRLFGTLALDVRLKIVSGAEGGEALAWSRSLTFPGLRAGETLSRRTTLPRRGALLARDGSVLADGEATGTGRATRRSGPRRAPDRRSRPDPQLASHVAGSRGVPSDAVVGTSGLEPRSTRACAVRPAESCRPARTVRGAGSRARKRPRRTPRAQCARASRPPCSAPPSPRSAPSSAASSRSRRAARSWRLPGSA